MIGFAMALAITALVVSLTPSNAQDYVFAGFFLICTVSFLKLRWLLGSVALLTPLAALLLPNVQRVVPDEAFLQLSVAWAVGTMMSFLADSYRRWGMFSHVKGADCGGAVFGVGGVCRNEHHVLLAWIPQSWLPHSCAAHLTCPILAAWRFCAAQQACVEWGGMS